MKKDDENLESNTNIEMKNDGSSSPSKMNTAIMRSKSREIVEV